MLGEELETHHTPDANAPVRGIRQRGLPADAETMRLSLLAFVAVTAAFLATTAGAAPTPLAPAPGSSTTSTHPTFRWRVAVPEVSDSITIAKSPRLTANGEFVTADLVDEDDLQPDATSWSPTRPLPAGTYWWHVGSVDTTPGAAPGDLFTPVAKLTVRAAVAAKSLKLQWSARQFLVLLSVQANLTSVNVDVRLFSGAHLIESHRATTNNFNLDQPTIDQSVFTIPSNVKHGTKLRLIATLTIKGTTTRATLVKNLRAP
jgi:hypothetical protein